MTGQVRCLLVIARRFGAKAWYVHLGFALPARGAFIAMVADLGRSVRWPLPGEFVDAVLGLVLISVGLWIAACFQLGPERVANGYFFGRGPTEPVEGGVFRWSRDPMHDSYFRMFLDFVLAKANAAYLLIAAGSFLFNLFEARVENRPYRRPEP